MSVYNHSPAHAGDMLLKRAVVARGNLRRIRWRAIRASGLTGDDLFEALLDETARIRKMDYLEVAAELAEINKGSN